jgi:hypothetical protein
MREYELPRGARVSILASVSAVRGTRSTPDDDDVGDEAVDAAVTVTAAAAAFCAASYFVVRRSKMI